MGAITISGTWRIATTPEPVWDVVADLQTWPRWWPAISEVTTSAQPAGGAGEPDSAVGGRGTDGSDAADVSDAADGSDAAGDRASLTFDTPSPLRPLVVELQVVDRAPPERLVATTVGGPLDGNATMELVRVDDHTAVNFDISLRVRSLLFRPLESILAGATRSSGRERLRKAGDDLAELTGARALDHDV